MSGRERRTGRQRAPDDGGDDETELRDPPGGEEHHRHRGEEQQLDHAGLGEADVRHHDVARRGPSGDVLRREDTIHSDDQPSSWSISAR